MIEPQIIFEELDELSGRLRTCSVLYPQLTANYLAMSNRINDYLHKPTSLKLQKMTEDLYIIREISRKLLEQEELRNDIEPIYLLSAGLLE